MSLDNKSLTRKHSTSVCMIIIIEKSVITINENKTSSAAIENSLLYFQLLLFFIIKIGRNYILTKP